MPSYSIRLNTHTSSLFFLYLNDAKSLESLLYHIATGNLLADKIAYKKWELQLNSNTAFDQKFATEKTQIFGIMLGQMSDSSKDLTKECEIEKMSAEAA